jgi:hypothetical protein
MHFLSTNQPGRDTVEGLVKLATLGRCHNHVGLIGQKGPHWGVVRCQAIVWCKFCEIWWRDEALNALRKKPHEHLSKRLMMKKMNNLDDALSGLSLFFLLFFIKITSFWLLSFNLGIWLKFNMVFQLLISLIAPLSDPKLAVLYNFAPVELQCQP